MAKLESVMVVGKNIEVGGVTYERTVSDVRAGDIVQCFESDFYLTRGAFYKVERIDSDGYIVIKDDVGDGRYRHQNDSDFVHFRKVGVEPAFKVGDYVRVITDDEELPKGTIGKIVYVDSDDLPYMVEALDGSDYYLFNAYELKKVDEQTAKWAAIGRKVGEFKKGDIVRVVNNRGGHFANTNDVLRVWTIVNYGPNKIRCEYVDGARNDCDYFYEDELELIAPVECVVNLPGASE